jgi:hypothetical protein
MCRTLRSELRPIAVIGLGFCTATMIINGTQADMKTTYLFGFISRSTFASDIKQVKEVGSHKHRYTIRQLSE